MRITREEFEKTQDIVELVAAMVGANSSCVDDLQLSQHNLEGKFYSLRRHMNKMRSEMRTMSAEMRTMSAEMEQLRAELSAVQAKTKML